MQEYTESGYRFIQIIIKKRIHFLVVTAVAVMAAALFSSEWFIKPKYRSFAVVYPSNITPYSEESASEQMLQLFRAADVRNAVVKKFDLYKHYGIDSSDRASLASMIGNYESNVEVNRTQFESVEITVLDEDPVKASEMVLEIIHQMNMKARALQREKTREVEVVINDQDKHRQRHRHGGAQIGGRHDF